MEPEKTPRERAEDLMRLLVSDWRPTPQQVLWAIRIAIALCLLVAIGYAYGITLWDWLKLLIVPAVIAIGGLWFNQQQQERQQQDNRQQQERGLKIERERAQDEALQAYLDQIGQLLLDRESPLRQSEEGDEVRTLARVRTLTVLTRLDGDRKGSVLQFLYETGLIKQSGVILELKGADVSEADLTRVTPTSANLNISSLLSGGTLSRMDLNRISRVSTLNGADLGQANLSRANLSRTDMFKTDLFRANLSGADLSGTFLSEANLASADLSGAKLVGADLSKVELFSANLSGADLRNADLSETTFLDANLSNANLKGAVRWDQELLRGAKTLASATMPDGRTLRGDKTPNGPTFEDWLREREGDKVDGKNRRSS